MAAADKTITVKKKVADVLTNVTSVKFNNSAGTIGVRRQDTQASVVAAGTAITNQSTGVYQYTIDGSLLVAGVTYEYWVEVLYSGAYTRQERTFVAVEEAASGMSAATARSIIRAFTRNGASTDVYSNADVDYALMNIGNRFCRKTQCVKTKTQVTLTAEDEDLPAFPSGLSNFRPENVIKAWIDDEEPLIITEYLQLEELRRKTPAAGVPTHLAFITPTTARVYPTPALAHVVNLWWWEPFTSWTAGESATLNIPERYLHEILECGVPPLLMAQGNEDVLLADKKWKRYLDLERSLMGAGHLGAKVVYRQKAD